MYFMAVIFGIRCQQLPVSCLVGSVKNVIDDEQAIIIIEMAWFYP